jgi:hypothetical protein
MIHPALSQLMRLQFRGALRRTGRAMRTPKGAVFAIIGGAVLVVWLGSVLGSVLMGTRTDPAKVRALAPVVLLLLCVANLFGGGGEKAIAFTPGEINFLFPGPFTRRELLLYKLAKTVAATVAFAGFMSLVLLPHAGGYVAAFVGAFLGVLFTHLLALTVVMTGQAVGERAYTRGRRLALLLLGVAVAFAVAPAVAAASRAGAAEFVSSLQNSTAAQVLLAPFTVFTRVFTARAIFPDLLLWASAAAAIDVALLVLVLRLDADYLEAAAAASRRVRERLERMRSATRVSPAAARQPGRGRVPMLPWLGGAGPTAWRQLTTALRVGRSTLVVLLFICVAVVWMTAMGQGHLVALATGGGWATLFLSTMLKLDFRSDLDQIAALKAMPLRPTATAVGQLAVPVLLLSVVHLVLLGSAAALTPPARRHWAFVAMLFVLPFNVLLLAIENAMFLLFPSRAAGTSPGDLGQMGRGVVFFLAKVVALTVACGVSAALGAAAGALAGGSAAVGVGVGLLAFAATAAAAMPFVGWAYRHFDPSADTPP